LTVESANPVLVLVGGFLGAGKTTLLLHAADKLRAAGRRVAMITNDQGGNLVDTRFAAAAGTRVEEIVGGCFCCRFSDLVNAVERLQEYHPDVILAEPVGSCIDMAATVLRPIQRFYPGRWRLAPFTVLVDPQRARELLATDADPNLAYLFSKQLAEADLLCFNKSDLHDEFPELPGRFALRLSAVTGQGVTEWLDEILAGHGSAGSRPLEVDYRQYADAEAALGWLNCHAEVTLTHEWMSPAQMVGPLLEELDRGLSQAGVSIAHLKIFDQTPAGYVKASICRNGEEPLLEGELAASASGSHDLLLNLRAPADPAVLRAIVEQASSRLPGDLRILHLESFRPAPPKPEHRIASSS
jgi:Ni2+-binding GTPase involved in maturation of urease and hydrogenase